MSRCLTAGRLAGQADFNGQPGIIGLSILDTQNFVATIPGTDSMLRMRNGDLEVFENQDGLSKFIVSLDMISLDYGWAKSVDSRCDIASSFDLEADTVSCESTTRLLRTIFLLGLL